jgi:hypothetical protein
MNRILEYLGVLVILSHVRSVFKLLLTSASNNINSSDVLRRRCLGCINGEIKATG